MVLTYVIRIYWQLIKYGYICQQWDSNLYNKNDKKLISFGCDLRYGYRNNKGLASYLEAVRNEKTSS